jgi:mono/diheme cytochrome c family protein
MQSGTHVAPAAASFDVPNLFANTCGWCHFDAGRKPGKGPQLMGTALSDGEIVYRIKNGKVGAMPAFGSQFTEEQLQAIVAYIRALKPQDPSK